MGDGKCHHTNLYLLDRIFMGNIVGDFSSEEEDVSDDGSLLMATRVSARSTLVPVAMAPASGSQAGPGVASGSLEAGDVTASPVIWPTVAS